MNASINVYRFQKVLNELMKQNTKTHTVFITLIYLKFGGKKIKDYSDREYYI